MIQAIKNFFGSSQDNSKKKQKIQINLQTQAVDQNYANSILFMCLSVLETLENNLVEKSTKINNNTKQFGCYDRYDYSQKSITELKGQLRNNVMLLAHSRAAFQITYGPNSYKLPKNYDEKKVKDRLSRFQKFFNQKQKQCSYLCKDIQRILSQKRPENLYYEKMMNQEIKQPNNKKQFFVNAILATQEMRNQEKRVKEKYGKQVKPQELEFKVNPGYRQKYS